MNQPVVSVSVIAYNSSRYIIETLESIKAQTYPNIELIVSDDKSTDNTVQLCEDWIAKNKDRFVRTQIIVPEHNTGVSGNCNRASAACQGEWEKGIAGDDKLLPNCISDFMAYVAEHPDAKLIFGRMTGFGADKETIEQVLKRFDYSFFSMTPEQQLHRLLYKGNCLPAPATFANREYFLNLGIKNDERVANLEDWAKWINYLRAGIKFHFMDKDVVSYRVNSGISVGFPRESYFQSLAIFRALYIYPEFYKNGMEEGARLIMEK